MTNQDTPKEDAETSEIASRKSMEFHDDLGPEPIRIPWLTIGMFVAIMFISLAIYIARTSDKPQALPDHPAVGNQLQGIRLQPFTGNSIAIDNAQLRGKVTLINYWGPWCYPCILEMPELLKLRDEFKDDPTFQFLAVSCSQSTGGDQDELKTQTIDLIKRQSFDLVTYADPIAESRRSLAQSAQIGNVPFPTTVLVDEQLRIQGLWVGYNAKMLDVLRTRIPELLEDGVQ